MVSEIFDEAQWREVEGFEGLEDVTYHRARELGCVRVAFDRPQVRNAFRPKTVDELYRVLDHARQWSEVGCVLVTGNGPSQKDGGWAFSSGGDQRVRGEDGYKYEGAEADQPDPARLGRLHILEVQRLIRFMPKVGNRGGAGMGGGRGPQLARGVRHDAGEPGARAVQADGRGRGELRRGLRLGAIGAAGGAEAGPGDLLHWP